MILYTIIFVYYILYMHILYLYIYIYIEKNRFKVIFLFCWTVWPFDLYCNLRNVMTGRDVQWMKSQVILTLKYNKTWRAVVRFVFYLPFVFSRFPSFLRQQGATGVNRVLKGGGGVQGGVGGSVLWWIDLLRLSSESINHGRFAAVFTRNFPHLAVCL